jgi:adenylyltransferase and sulfurtransferase
MAILDVRSPTEFSICHLDGSTSTLDENYWFGADKKTDIPLMQLLHNPASYLPIQENVLVVCKLGNDSQIAVKSLIEANQGSSRIIMDMIGGLRLWSRLVDPEFPVY